MDIVIERCMEDVTIVGSISYGMEKGHFFFWESRVLGRVGIEMSGEDFMEGFGLMDGNG